MATWAKAYGYNTCTSYTHRRDTTTLRGFALENTNHRGPQRSSCLRKSCPGNQTQNVAVHWNVKHEEMKQWSDSVICEYEATHHPLEAMPTSEGGGKTFCCFTFCKWDGVCLWPSSPKRKVVKTSKLLCLVNCQPQVELRTRFSWATKLSLKKRSRRHGGLLNQFKQGL